MFARGEVSHCPECGVAVQPLAELPPSTDAASLDPPNEALPEHELYGWAYAGRGRGPLLLIALLGMLVFLFAPWLAESAPEIVVLTGLQFARALPWLWAAGVGWVVLFALVLSRRTIAQMHGARLAVALMALMVLSAVALRLAIPVPAQRLLPRRFHWGWGLYAAGFLALTALFYAWRFGGGLTDMPTRRQRDGDETLH